MNRNRWSIVTVIAIGLLAATSSSQVISDATADPTDPIPSTEPIDPLLDPLDPIDPMDPLDDPIDDPVGDPLGGEVPEISGLSVLVTGDDVELSGTVVGDFASLIVEELTDGSQATITPDGHFVIVCSALAEFAYIQASDVNGAGEIVQFEID